MKVLHVDDDPDIRAITLIALETVGGFHVLQCASGQEAIYRAPAYAPDVIILDVMMPGLDGEQTLLRLRELDQFSGVPIIFMTAKVHAQAVDSFFKNGAAGVITKPFDPMTLAQQVKEMWESAGASRSERI